MTFCIGVFILHLKTISFPPAVTTLMEIGGAGASARPRERRERAGAGGGGCAGAGFEAGFEAGSGMDADGAARLRSSPQLPLGGAPKASL